MTAFAPVANLEMYRRLLKRNQLGNYHLLIATEVVKDLEDWGDFWRGFPFGGEDIRTPFIIMDNGLIEAGAATDPQTLREAAEAVRASCVVLPDVLGDYEKTVKAVRAAYAEMASLGYPLMGVVQGRSWLEILSLVELYHTLNVSYLSVPRVMTSIFGSRVQLVKDITKYSKRPIHLLGFSDNLADDMAAAVLPGVMGIDSAVPLWYQGLLPPTPPVLSDFGRRPKGYWNMSPDHANYENIARIREWLNVAQAVHTAEALRERGGTRPHLSASSEKPLEPTSSEREYRS
jgi:hypothetical protein